MHFRFETLVHLFACVPCLVFPVYAWDSLASVETMSDGLMLQDELRETLALHDELLRELGAENR